MEGVEITSVINTYNYVLNVLRGVRTVMVMVVVNNEELMVMRSVMVAWLMIAFNFAKL